MKFFIGALFFSYSCFAYGQHAELQVTVGADVLRVWDRSNGTYFGGTFQLKKYFGLSRWRVSFNYLHKYDEGANINKSNGVVTQVYPFIAHARNVSIIPEYQVYRSKKDYHRGFSVGLGPSYYFAKFNRSKTWSGPGLTLKLEYQGGLKGSWYWGVESLWASYLSRSPYQPPVYLPDADLYFKINPTPLIFKIGVIPGLKKFKKKAGGSQ